MGRLLMIVAVAIFAAQPVMACCLTGHAEPPRVQMPAEPACHDDMHDAAAGTPMDTHNTADQPECPGSPGCDKAVMQAQAFEDWTVSTAGPVEIPAGVVEARYTGFEPHRIVLTTGPPRDRPPPLSSPVILKQRLLI